MLTFFLSLVFIEASAQSYTIKLQFNPSNTSLQKKIKIADKYPDSASVVKQANEALALAQKAGYLLAEKSVTWQKSEMIVNINLKQKYQVEGVSNGNIAPEILQRAGFSEKNLASSLYNYSQIEALMQKLVGAYQNSGYPFASVYLDSVSLLQNKLKAKLYSSPGQLFIIDSLQITGDTKVSKTFLQSYLNIKTGSIYNESHIRDLEKRLKELNFVSIAKKPEVIFSSNKAKIILYLNKQNASQFDGILGFLPDNNTGKLQLTGDIKLHLQNAFKRAEIVDFSFKGLPGKSRELNLGAGVPELFSTPLGIDASFSLFKQDTNFQNVNFRGGINYRISRGAIKMFISTYSGAPVASIDSTDNTDLPSFATINVISYGTGWQYRTLNEAIVPTRGFAFQIEAEAGRKNVSSSSLPQQLKDSIQLKSSQYRLKSTAEVYFQLSRRGIIKLNNQTGLLLGRNFFENELYRIGGFNSLRGFDEQSILATNYSIFNAEYRFLIENRSFLFAFINQGFIKKSSVKNYLTDKPIGFGCGISLETKAGMFSLSYALGKQKDNPLNLQGGKIHFGLITLF